MASYLNLDWDGQRLALEYQWIHPELDARHCLVFLHEGLGSISMWRDWPAQLCQQLGCRGLLYSRYGYGNSTPSPTDTVWPIDYLQQQAQLLPHILQALNLYEQAPFLVGHSDGASIALLYASQHSKQTAGIVVMAPHIFVEDVTLAGIRQARQAYLDGHLGPRLQRYHQDVDSAFWGWNQAWLQAGFEQWNIEAELPRIHCPVLAIQGVNDEYGTLAQIEQIQAAAKHTELAALADCGHSPQRDQGQACLTLIDRFVRQHRR